jgi:hypothetical protein
MKIGQPDALGCQSIQVWRPEHGVPVNREIAITLIIRNHDDDVGWDRVLWTVRVASQRRVVSQPSAQDDGEGNGPQRFPCNHGVLLARAERV